MSDDQQSPMDASDDETMADPALRELIDQRKRLVAALAEAAGADDSTPLMDAAEDISGSGPPSGDDNGEPPTRRRRPNNSAADELLSVQAMTDDGDASGGLALSDEDEDLEDYDFDDEDVDKLLEESLATGATPASALAAAVCPHSSATARGGPVVDDRFNGLSQPPAIKSKVVLKHRGMEYFEVLPDGWIEVTHTSGVPVFLHKTTRVCTLSRPYFIGPGSVRNHDVPISAIPCYYQRKVREVEAEKEKQRHQDESTTGGGDETQQQKQAPKVKVQTVDDFKNRNLNSQQLHEYCSSTFEFETINVMRFKSWSDHRVYRKKQKQELRTKMNDSSATPTNVSTCPSKMLLNGLLNKRAAAAAAAAAASVSDATSTSGRPMLPTNMKLITVPDMERGSKPQQKPFYLNPQGRTSIAVLHEYVQKVMKGSVSYEFTETRNAANPYCATVRITTHDRQRAQNGGGGGEKQSADPTWTEYGKGEGNSKKNAKLNAAKQAMRVLVPGIEFNADGVADLPNQDDAGQLFDLIKITDSRVPELSAKAGQPTPFVILQECLKRHSSFGDTTIDMDIQRLKHQQHEFTMKVAKHEVKVQCTNKKEGKQRAAQAMLEKLHPQITTWGSLIRLYGYGAQRKLLENRKEKDSIIRLVQNRKQNQLSDEPNVAILDKLKQEMIKLYQPQKHDDTSAAVETNAATIGTVKNIDI